VASHEVGKGSDLGFALVVGDTPRSAGYWGCGVRLVLRVVLGVVGVGLCAIGVSAASKLFGETLDSDPWMIAALAVVYFVLGLMALWAGVSGLRRP
jgi:hypothetical protein